MKRAFVFVHGFNVSFEEAAKRTAQMAYDLEFDGAPIFYSWPAHGGEFRYRADEEAVIETVQSLREFLEGVAEKSGADQIHLIAHSMGNRALTSALRAIAIDSKWSGKQMFQEVLLAAPDIGEKDFRETIYPAIRTTAHQMTLYASANDRALLISRNINKERRVGDAQGGICCLPNLDSVDVSAVDTSFVGHSYYGENSSVITDIRAVLRRESARLKWEWLKQTYAEELPFWVFRAMPTPAEKLAKRPVEIVR